MPRENRHSSNTGPLRDGPAVLLPRQQAKPVRGAKDKEHAMSQIPNTAIAVIGIDIGKSSFHVVGHDARGAVVLRQKWSRGQVEARLANIPPCLIGMEACVGAHHLSRKLASLGHDARLMPAKYVRPYSKGQKNDFNDAEAIAEAVQRPTMKFVATSHLVTSATNEKTAPRGLRRIGATGGSKTRPPAVFHARHYQWPNEKIRGGRGCGFRAARSSADVNWC
jgi:Transposase